MESEERFRKWTTINTTNPEVNKLDLFLNCTTSYEFKVKAWNALGSSEAGPNAWPIRTGGSQLRKDSKAGSSPSLGINRLFYRLSVTFDSQQLNVVSFSSQMILNLGISNNSALQKSKRC